MGVGEGEVVIGLRKEDRLKRVMRPGHRENRRGEDTKPS